mgnify:FL=1
MNAATVGGRRRVVTLLCDVRTLTHNAITQTWRPIPPNDSTPETTAADWNRLLGMIDRSEEFLEQLRYLANRALSELEPAIDIADIEPSTSTGAPA